MDSYQNIIAQLIAPVTLGCIMLAPLVLFVTVLGWRKKHTSQRSRYPFDITSMVRIPAYGVLQQYNDKSQDLLLNLMMLMYFALWPFAYVGINHLLSLKSPNFITIMLMSIAILIYLGTKAFKISRQQSDLRLGMEAEWFTAVELLHNLPTQYKVFNDIQGENFNIDHLVVGPNGVFAIETKGRRKPNLAMARNPQSKANGHQEHVVKVDGEILKFPHYEDSQTVQQAKRQAVWTRKWLQEATGSDLQVIPVVSLPGWFVENISKPQILVASAKNLTNVLQKSGRYCLDEQRISTLVYQIKQRCLRQNDEF